MYNGPFFLRLQGAFKASMKSKSNRNIFFCLIAANNHIAKLWLTCNWGTCCGPTGFFVYTNTPVYKYSFILYIHPCTLCLSGTRMLALMKV